MEKRLSITLVSIVVLLVIVYSVGAI